MRPKSSQTPVPPTRRPRLPLAHRCTQFLAAGAIALAACAGPGGTTASAAPATVDLAVTHQTIRGFGGATVFQPPGLPASLAEAELDALFGTGPGQIGFTILRIRVAEDAAWRAIELAHAQGAIARGASVIATPWSPPAAMKSNSSLIGGRLNPSSYAAYATYLDDFARMMAANGAPLHAISVQNEPDIDVTYESCDWTPAEMLDFCRNFAGAISATRVMAPESFQFRRNMSDPILNDELATAHVDIIGGHIYGGGLARYPLAESRGREVWMTEYLELTTDWAGALDTAREIHDCLATANFSAYVWWYARRYYGPLGEDGVVTRRGHVMAQFSKFIRPGSMRVDATANPAPGVRVSAFRREGLVIVAINEGTAPVSQTFTILNGSVPAVTPWITSATLSQAAQPAITVSGASFTAELPAGSVTTFVGERVLAAPAITAQPRSITVEAGGTAVMEVAASGEFVSYQWSHDGSALPGATARTLVLSGVQPADAGGYTVTATNPAGGVTSESATLAVVATGDPGRLVNLSARTPVGSGDAVLVGGFVIEGAGARSVLVRAAGPALAEGFGIEGVLENPMITVHAQASGALLDSNDDWDAALAPTAALCGAFPWTAGSRDAAALVALGPGGYTASVHGEPGATGVALLELYEVPGDPAGPRLVNLSTRSRVGSGFDAQIAGFVIRGSTARTVLIRASGPALAQVANLAGTIPDPVIDLRDQTDGRLLASADGWDDAAGALFATVGAFGWRPGSRDAALVATLGPGAYTASVRDRNGGPGLALVEVYAVP